jgi:hypothetical protein
MDALTAPVAALDDEVKMEDYVSESWAEKMAFFKEVFS